MYFRCTLQGASAAAKPTSRGESFACFTITGQDPAGTPVPALAWIPRAPSSSEVAPPTPPAVATPAPPAQTLDLISPRMNTHPPPMQADLEEGCCSALLCCALCSPPSLAPASRPCACAAAPRCVPRLPVAARVRDARPADHRPSPIRLAEGEGRHHRLGQLGLGDRKDRRPQCARHRPVRGRRAHVGLPGAGGGEEPDRHHQLRARERQIPAGAPPTQPPPAARPPAHPLPSSAADGRASSSPTT